ncbi:MAG: trypsin-like peptidase domain-containing protein [Rhodospirillaceae bacterium]|nr:trypsin-like peptidase domain-containing protein [Rhodospirillaceae bacterium]
MSEARKGAQAGEARAQRLYGQMLLKDTGPRADPREGVTWLKAAADQGDALARRDLGNAYLTGSGVPKDLLQAYVRVSLAVRARNPQASDLRRELAQQISADQRREGDQLARAWGASRVEAKAVAARMTGTGTGFIVAADSHIVTNDHVIRGCKEIRIRRIDESVTPAKLVAQSGEEDLALLKVELRADAVAPFRAVGDLRQGDAIVAFGYPLAGTLAGSGNLMAGNVTAVAGLGNDTRFVQTSTAPQPGNTGGPLLDLNDRVVGVTTASIGTQAAGQTAGGAAQNLNFAIKGDVAAAFLRKNGVAAATTGGAPRAISPAEVADRAKRFTVRVECLT